MAMKSYQLTVKQDDLLYEEWDALRGNDIPRDRIDSMFGEWLKEKYDATYVEPVTDPGAILYFETEEQLNWFLLKL